MRMNLLNDEVNYIQLERLEDIIRIMSTSTRPPPIHRKKVEDGHVYFLPASIAVGKSIIYFVKVKEKVEIKYIVFDRIQDEISFSNELSTKPSLSHFSIVEVTSENMLPRRGTPPPKI